MAAMTLRVGDSALRFADALVLAVFQHAQQLRLQFEGQLADLVEEQRALVRILEITRARVVAPVKAPFT